MSENSTLPHSVGFIGLGAMGKPMVANLARKLPPGSQIRVHDVVEAAVEDIKSSFPDTIIKCSNAREVTEGSVGIPDHECFFINELLTMEMN